MNLYLVSIDRAKDDYYVIADDMNKAGEKVINHLSATYKTLISIINVKFIASAVNENTREAFKPQFFLVL